MLTRDDASALDAADLLAPLRDQFDLPRGTIYLDGNSLGALPKATSARLRQVIEEEWGRELIRSWNGARWITLAQRVGDKIARLVGAGTGELVVADSTSVNLFKTLSAALSMGGDGTATRRVVLSERSNFPTDLYVAESVARERGCGLILAGEDELQGRLDSTVAVLLLTHVNYRTGRMHDMAALCRAAHSVGALTIWDLAHSAGAVPVDLRDSGADFAIGCGYKYLNGGPGAPAFVWVHPRHADRVTQPLAGWLGHAVPFAFAPEYRPAAGILRFQCGTPPVLSLAALDCGVDSVLAAEPFGGMAALRAKSLALTAAFIDAIETRCAGHGLDLVTPRDPALRGSQVCFSRAEGGEAILQALAARGVIGDFRAGSATGGRPIADILRFGFTPLYTRFVDVLDAVEQLREVLETAEWRQARFQQRATVT